MMNLNEFNNFLKANSGKFTKTKCNYFFMKRITLRNVDGNYDMPVTPVLTSMEYKLFSKLVEKYL